MVELKYKKIEMTDDELRDKKLHLAYCKLQKDESDVNLEEMEEHLEQNLANRLLDDDIKKISEDMEAKITYDTYGKEIPATEADIARMQVTLNKFNKQRKLDLPGRQLRLNINKLREAKVRPDAPEKQIKKLEKEIREKAYDMVDNDREAPGVN
jgi:translation elongation factor EF-1beta